jgi:folate-binding protein YgfZ
VLTKRAGFAELVGRTSIAVTGPDRAAFLQSFTTNDIKRLTPGTGCEAFVTSTQGKTLGHVFVFCEADQIILDTSPDQASSLIAHFSRYVITEEVDFTDQTPNRRVILLAGPEAANAIEHMSGNAAPVELLAHQTAAIAGQNVTIRRTPYAGSHSFFLEVAAADFNATLAALRDAAVAPCDADAVEVVRQEVGRDRQAISFTKGCYLGQETVARIDALGHVNRLLRGLRFSGPAVPAVGTALLAGGQPIGHVTSAAWSPRLSAPLALAYIRRQHAKPGTSLAWEGGTADVVGLPLGAAA